MGWVGFGEEGKARRGGRGGQEEQIRGSQLGVEAVGNRGLSPYLTT